MSAIPGIGLLKVLNPVELAVDVGGSLLGLPPEITAAAKVGIGAATGNFMMVASGSIELATSAAGVAMEVVSNIAEKVATSEYFPSSNSAIASKGYAASSGGSNSELQKTEQHLETFQRYLPLLDKSGTLSLIGAFDGLFDKRSLEMVCSLPFIPPDLREAARFFIQRPGMFDQLETAAKIGRPDGRVGLADVESMLDNVRAQLLGKTSPEAVGGSDEVISLAG